MSTSQAKNMASLSSDIFYDILRRVDGPSLASAACTCASLSSISKEETLWENVCSSMWPSTNREDVKNLISSIGGFRKFFANCFPLIVNKDVTDYPWNSDYLEYPDDWTEAEYYGEIDGYDSTSPSDFVFIVDIGYKDKIMCSKALWGIPNVNGSSGWFYNCPFQVDLLRDGENGGEAVILSVSDGLHPIESLEKERKYGKLWRDLREGLRLSWIVVNRKIKKAANLSSWSCLGGQRHWPTDKDFAIRFGSVLSAKQSVLTYQAVECVLVMKYRVVQTEEDGYHETSLKLTELSMKLEDMEGSHVNGRSSLLILKEALSCRRSKNYGEVMESCYLYSKAQNELKEEKMRNENMLDRLCILTGIAAFLTFWYYVL